MNQLINRFSLVGIIAFLSLLFSSPARGQISSDRTLPTNVNQSGNVFEITGGAVQDTNLFHSFGEFSVPNGFEAFFNNGLTIDNIISRVTGGEVSSINGLIRARGTANLILINPAGISFGSGASLDIGGSFLGSSGNSIRFEDGTVFSADPNQTPLLTVTAPIGVGFAPNPGNIQSQGANLTLPSGQTFALIGGNVTLDNTIITAPAGNIEIASVGSDGLVSLTAIPQGWRLGFDDVSNFQDIQIISGSRLASTQRIEEPQPFGPSNFIYSPFGGNISIRGRDITIFQGTEATLPTLLSRGQFGAGDITIQGQNITINQGSQQFDDFEFFNPVDTIDADSLSNQLAGTITIDGQQITIADSVGISSEIWNQPDSIQGEPNPNVGGIFIGTNTDGNSINISNESQIITDTHGFHEENQTAGSASNIVIGNLNSQEVIIEQGSEIATESHTHTPEVFGNRTDFDAGQAGNITIRGQQVNITGNNTSVTATAFGNRPGGNIVIEGTSITIEDQARVIAETSGATDDAIGGNISIGRNSTNNEIIIDNATVSVTTGETLADSHGNDDLGFANAPAGNILIGNSNTTLDILNGSGIIADTIQAEGLDPGNGSAGNITIDANEFNLIQEAIIESKTGTLGNAGNIVLEIGNLLNIDNSSQISVTSESSGRAGDISIFAESLLLSNNGLISSETETGDVGNIEIESDQVVLRNNSNISTNSNQTSNGGNISFTGFDSNSADFIALVENSNITANAATQGQGGRIFIDALGVFNCGNCEITALGGVEGVVEINTPEVQNTLEFLDVPQQIVNSEEVVASACSVDKGKQTSQFTITGRGGLPPSPTSSLSSEALVSFESDAEINDNRSGSTKTTEEAEVEQLPSPARGWYLNQQGNLVLTANRSNISPYDSGTTNPDCHSISTNE